MKKIIVWRKSDNSYYFRTIVGIFPERHVGDKNQYGHEVILIIDIDNLCYNAPYSPLRKRLLMKIISFLEKLNKKI